MPDYMCEELMINILSRLPPKSLLRFRSVSKSLRSCIDSPSFIRLRTLRSSTTKVFIRHMCNQGLDVDFYTLHTKGELPLCPQTGYNDTKPIKYNFSSSVIVGSCNGIFCLADDEKDIYLWNPSIRRAVKVHDLTSWSLNELYGFGFDPIVDDYKILKISYSLSGQWTSSVYAVKTGIWSEISSTPTTTSFSTEVSRSCFLNGALHWLVKRIIRYDHMSMTYLNILTFDLSTHVFGEIELPKRNWESGHLIIIEGCLAASSSRDGKCLIWIMREYNWSVFFVFGLNVIGRDLQVLPFSTNDKDLMITTLRDKITVYNLDTRVQQRVAAFSASSTIINAEVFAESLELLNWRNTYKENELSFIGRRRSGIRSNK
uniref:putative F-box protein At3g16210 n=1 Tax=Erigeron canadensis TaxID=72917 RepID=UPI001CB99E3C|nr:putative F-box protein At3g16210 [Erigeron canadensis]